MVRVRRVVVSLREGRFTSIGSYPKFFHAADGSVLSHEAVRSELGQVLRATRDDSDRQWCIRGEDINWEDPSMYCEHTGDRIESAYGEAV